MNRSAQLERVVLVVDDADDLVAFEQLQQKLGHLFGRMILLDVLAIIKVLFFTGTVRKAGLRRGRCEHFRPQLIPVVHELSGEPFRIGTDEEFRRAVRDTFFGDVIADDRRDVHKRRPFDVVIVADV